MYLSEPAPDIIGVLGDLHGNTRWALRMIRQMSPLLPEDGLRLIMQVGDFGFWPGDRSYLTSVSRTLDAEGIVMWFIDGNHEWHPRLAELHEHDDRAVPVDAGARIWHLPRGSRWSWHGQRWLAVGGAGSVDWTARIPGRSWWPEERISAAQADEIIAAGPADVLVAHDCPPSLMPVMPQPPSFWDFTYADQSAAQLQRILNGARPSLFIHGHLHMRRETRCGETHVTGLAADGGPGNGIMLDTRTLQISYPAREGEPDRTPLPAAPRAPVASSRDGG